METSGLKPDSDRILEIALIITDANLNTIATAPVWVVHQDDAVLDGMDAWNKGTHSKSGLIDRVKASTLNEDAVEEACIAFLKQYVKAGISPMCGNVANLPLGKPVTHAKTQNKKQYESGCK
jgi:oligoribonuclease